MNDEELIQITLAGDKEAFGRLALKYKDRVYNLVLPIVGNKEDALDVVQLLPYHKFGATKYDRLGIKYKLSNVEPPSDEFMQDALKLFQGMGLNAMIH